MKVRYLLIVVVALFVAGVLNVPSYAAIDPKTVVGMWLFDEPLGKVVKDSSSKGHNGQVMGKLEQVEGKFGKALKFPGTMADYVEVPDHDDLRITKAITLVGWVSVNTTGANIVGKDYTGKRSYNIHVTSDADASGAGKAYMSGTVAKGKTSLTDSKWHHVAATWDGTIIKMYSDGVEEASVAFAGPITTFDVPVEIGRRESGSIIFKGAIDEVGIF